jgi:serine/threonine protein kinase
MAQPAEESKAMQSAVFQSKYRVIKSVGKGSFGEAVLVRSKADGKRYIAKAIESAAMSSKEKRDVQNEIKILAAVNHPNIVRYLEHFEDGTLIFIVMEYADGGDLSSRIKDAKKMETPKPFEPKLAMFWFLQICMAMKYLHDNHILHRDLKTANVFLTSKNVVKLGDFGISTVLQNTMACAKTVCGTPYYFSPELCQSKPYNNKSDVWALGIIFYEVLTLTRPFNAKTLKDLIRKIVVGQYEPIPATVPVEMRTLCASLLQINPAMRPSINRILDSSYVQTTLKTFSAELEDQAQKDKQEFDTKKSVEPPKTAPIQQAPAQQTAPAAPQPSLRDQMAALRGMNRDDMRAAVAQAQPTAPVATTQQVSHSHDDVDDDGSHIDQKRAIAQQSKAMVGAKFDGPDEFGDGPSDSAPQDEQITMANGQTIAAAKVRGILEAEMGGALLNKAVEYVSDMMSGAHAPSNVEMQRELNALVGSKFAHHSNAITKLAVWEGKVL